jgi:hypothetical protein
VLRFQPHELEMILKRLQTVEIVKTRELADVLREIAAKLSVNP